MAPFLFTQHTLHSLWDEGTCTEDSELWLLQMVHRPSASGIPGTEGSCSIPWGPEVSYTSTSTSTPVQQAQCFPLLPGQLLHLPHLGEPREPKAPQFTH